MRFTYLLSKRVSTCRSGFSRDEYCAQPIAAKAAPTSIHGLIKGSLALVHTSKRLLAGIS